MRPNRLLILLLLAVAGCAFQPAPNFLGRQELERQSRSITVGAQDDGPAPEGGRIIRAYAFSSTPFLRGDLEVDRLTNRRLRDVALAELLDQVCPSRILVTAAAQHANGEGYLYRCPEQPRRLPWPPA